MKEITLKDLIESNSNTDWSWDIGRSVDGLEFGVITHNGYEIRIEELDRSSDGDVWIKFIVIDFISGCSDGNWNVCGTDKASHAIPFLIKRYFEFDRITPEISASLKILVKRFEQSYKILKSDIDRNRNSGILVHDKICHERSVSYNEGAAYSYLEIIKSLKRIID